MAGNQPVSTSPVFASDEMVAIRARGDFVTLTTASEQLAAGNDGVILSATPWTLTSVTVDFQAFGVAAQNVVYLTQPKSVFSGGGRMFAVDTVSPNTLTLRLLNKPPGVGQPPAINGATSVMFTINTFASLIEDASWDLKNRFDINEAVAFRASAWIYSGVEDQFRDLRAATVLQVLIKALSIENRAKDGDFWRKLDIFKKEYGEVLDRLQIRFGPQGNSGQPATLFSCQLAR